MEDISTGIDELKKQIAVTERELQRLKAQLASVEARNSFSKELEPQQEAAGSSRHLLPEEYRRYGRQMIVPSIGIQGQLCLRSAAVLIIGVGGLGCPAAAYLAGAGVGKIGLVDGDKVEVSNLHRQIIHDSSKIGMYKVESATCFLKRLNPFCQYKAYATPLTPQNAEEITLEYDLVLDCTDHPTSRYLISDISSLLQKPLISASALRGDGQLTILNWPPLPAGNEFGGPCYRCVFPKPPPVDSVISCGDGGIIGPVVGIMGVLQALEALRILTGGKLLHPSDEKKTEVGTTMLLFSACTGPQFRIVKLKGRRKGCKTCSDQAAITLEKLRSGDVNYELFCGMKSQIVLLDMNDRLQPDQYARQQAEGEEHLLVDVREKVQFDICSLPGSINVPFSKLQYQYAQTAKVCEKPQWLPESLSPHVPIYVICRSGNDSQVVTRQLRESGLQRPVKDIVGGFKAWREHVDPTWPEY